MKEMLEQHRYLKSQIENYQRSIRRIQSYSFEEYIEERTHRSTFGERRLQSLKPSNPTETLGVYGREQYERERQRQLRREQYRLQEKLAMLRQMDNMIERLSEQERVFIIKRYVEGMRVVNFCEGIGVSRATAFRKIDAAIRHMVDIYDSLFESAA